MSGTAGARPQVGLGCAPLGNLYHPITDDEATATVDAAWDRGIRFFDTAPLYGHGLSESRVGACYSNISVLRQAQFTVGGPPSGRMSELKIRGEGAAPTIRYLWEARPRAEGLAGRFATLWEARPRAESSGWCGGFAARAPPTRAALPQTPRTG